MAPLETIGILGAGAWGTALARTAARAGRRVVLFARDPEVVRSIRCERRNPRHLPDVALEPAIGATGDLGEVAAADALLLTVPAQCVRALAGQLPPGATPIVIAAKGFETATGLRLSQVVSETAPGRPIAALSGPNFAGEVARGLPAATTLGCAEPTLGRQLAEALSSLSFRVYWTDDLTGVEVGGAVKNVLAIAAGIVAGRGLGDLILSAGSLTSRNMAFGHAIGRGADPETLRTHPGALVEGVFTAGAVMRRARQLGVELPICAAVDAILDGRLGIAAALESLMSRPIRMEGG